MQTLQLRWWQYCFIFSPVLNWCVIKPAVWLQPCQWFTNNGMKANPNKFQFMILSSVREITKSSSTFSATNTSSNIVWSISTAWYNPNEIKWNLILVPNLVAFISQRRKTFVFFDYHSLTCSVRKMALICLMQNIDMYLLYKSHQIARLASHLINHFCKWMFAV